MTRIFHTIKKAVYSTLIALLPGVLAIAQSPTLVNSKKDTVPVSGSRAENFRKNEEERKKLESEKRQKMQQAENAASHTTPMFLSVLDLPAETPSFIKDSIDSYILRGMQQWQIPGLAIGIVKDGKLIFSKGYGVREMNRTELIDENTLFIIASNTKLFTGTSIAKLDFEKKLSLEDRVTKHLRWFRLYDTTSTRLATVRDMLCHRIGLKTFQGDFTFWDSNLPKDSIIWKMRFLKPMGEFRQDYGYCNSAFVVAGRILEKVTGNTWEKYIEDNMLKPLEMNNTYMKTEKLEMRVNVAQPHNNLFGPLTTIPFDRVDNMGPATSMVSNVKDLSHWLMMQLDSGRYNGKKILPWEVLQKTRDINIISGSRKSSVFPTHFRGYGLGVNATDYSGRQVYWHTGGAFGHVTGVCFIPEEKLGIVILSNNDNQNFFEALRYQILDAYLGVPYTDRSLHQLKYFVPEMEKMAETLNSMQSRVDKKNISLLKTEAYTGTYYHRIYGKITIKKSGEMLLCKFERHPELTGFMEYMDGHEFRMKYSHTGYGIYPATFTVVNGKPVSVEIKSNDFVEYDSYIFVKDPKKM